MATGCITWPTVVRFPKNLMNIALMTIVTFPNVIVTSLLFIPVLILTRETPGK